MIDSKIEVGDLVTLKSGGPTMTVESINESDEKCNCIFWNEHRTENTNVVFYSVCLKKVTE